MSKHQNIKLQTTVLCGKITNEDIFWYLYIRSAGIIPLFPKTAMVDGKSYHIFYKSYKC